MNPNETAIRRGIRTVGIGKKASRSLSPELVEEIVRDLRAGRVAPAERGAFFAALISKGMSPGERVLESVLALDALADPAAWARAITADAPPWVQALCGRLLAGETLDVDTAHRLGQYLLQPDSCNATKGLVASFLRVRYETPEEYEGLLEAMNETLERPFRQPAPAGDPILQLAEPFDGVDRSHMVTPLVARALKSLGYRVVSLVGRNSGPKWVLNLLDLIGALHLSTARSGAELGGPQPEFGWYLHQADISRAVDAWVEIRHQTIKRPFLATLEKFMDPVGADVLVTSAFHPPYGEKMLSIAERAGFPAAIVVRAGIEGTIGFSLNRVVKLLCSVRLAAGGYRREEIAFDPADLLQEKIDQDERRADLTVATNTRLILAHRDCGRTENRLFDARVRCTVAGLQQALNWIAAQRDRGGRARPRP